ncbi:MAG: hypothetical protein C0397_02105 [Odoribacter sp.]|nr:hypothetical protein [Odoribacter sp.]
MNGFFGYANLTIFQELSSEEVLVFSVHPKFQQNACQSDELGRPENTKLTFRKKSFQLSCNLNDINDEKCR